MRRFDNLGVMKIRVVARIQLLMDIKLASYKQLSG